VLKHLIVLKKALQLRHLVVRKLLDIGNVINSGIIEMDSDDFVIFPPLVVHLHASDCSSLHYRERLDRLLA